MDFKEGTHVYTSDGKDVGSVERVILDPDSNEVSGIVVRHGWLFSEDKVVPIRLIENAREDRVVLRQSKHDLQQLPVFEETYYVPANPEAVRNGTVQSYTADYPAPVYPYPPVGTAWWGFGSYFDLPPADNSAPEFTQRTKQNIPEGTVAVKEGARVLSMEGKHVGNVEEIFTDPATNHVTHIVISQGMLFKERKLIPTNWIKSEGEDSVTLTVNTGVIDSLTPYRD